MLSYKDFINENKLYTQDILNNVLNDLASIYEEEIPSSFQYLAHESENQTKILTRLEQLENRYGKSVLKDIVSNIDYDNIIINVGGDENALIDIFLNTYDKGYNLGGFDMNEDSNPIISYLYGWNKTHYGLKAIIDSFESLDNYYEFVMNKLKESHAIGDIKETYENLIIVTNSTNTMFGATNLEDFLTEGNVIVRKSKFNKNLVLGILTLPNSDKGINSSTNINNYIVDKLIRGQLYEYLEEFNLDFSHLEDGYIDKLMKSYKSIKKFNI